NSIRIDKRKGAVACAVLSAASLILPISRVTPLRTADTTAYKMLPSYEEILRARAAHRLGWTHGKNGARSRRQRPGNRNRLAMRSGRSHCSGNEKLRCGDRFQSSKRDR